MNKRIFLTLMCAAAAAHAGTLSLSNAALGGQPGATVGWGFTITSPQQWILITFADFVPDGGQNPVGVFTPFITQLPNSNTVIGPDDGNGEMNPWTQAFALNLQTGIGSYQINDFQSIGDQVTGQIVLDYDAYSVSPNDPLFDPDVDIIALGQQMSAATSVTVTPEPGTITLVLGALALCCRRRR